MALLTFMVFTFLFILYSAWRKFIKSGPIYKSPISLSGKTVLITGGSSGIGKEAAIGLAKHQAKVIIAARNIEKGQKAVEDIKTAAGNENVQFMMLDLSDLGNVRGFVKEFCKKEPRLDILVNCAGVLSDKRSETCGQMLSTNVLGPFLLTNLLLPLLQRTGANEPSRIVNVASDAYLIAEIDFENLDPVFNRNSSTWSILSYYAVTKLMMIYFTMELSRMICQDKKTSGLVSAFALHPGTAQSDLGASFVLRSAFFNFLRKIVMVLFSRPSYYCAQTILYCCIEPGLKDSNGGYFSEMKRVQLFPHAKEPGVGSRLWKELAKLSGLH